MLRNIRVTKCSYYDIGVTKCILQSVRYEMGKLRLWWQPKFSVTVFELRMVNFVQCLRFRQTESGFWQCSAKTE